MQATFGTGRQRTRFARSVPLLTCWGLVAGALVAVGAGGGSPALAAGPTLTVVDRASSIGLFVNDKSWAASTVDFDGDGDEDVWVGLHQWSGHLEENRGGHYVQVAQNAWPRVNPQSGKVTDRHDCAFADVDLDGRPDAYCSAGRNQSNLVKNGMENELWLQRAPGQFTNVGVSWGVGDVCGRGRHVTFLDVNGDAYPDLFVGNAVPRNVSDPCDVTSSGLPDEDSKIFINQGGTGFAQLANSGLNTLGIGQRCAERLDFDNDGWDDLVTCRFNSQNPRLYHNVHGTFVDVTNANGLTKNTSDVVVADMNADGWDDLVSAESSSFVYRLNQHGSFGQPITIGSATAGQARSVAVGDVDADGDLDVYGLDADTSGKTNPDDVLFINGGNAFSRLAVPRVGGNGDEVVAIHPVSPGPAEFLVLNGGDVSGPTQVIGVDLGSASPQPPHAVVGLPDCAGLTCSVDGSASFDPDGAILSYAWDFGDGASDAGSTASHTFELAGTYSIRLTVTDNNGLTATDARTVTVHEPGEPPGDPGALTFRAASASSAIGRSVSLSAPAGVTTGDIMLMWVSANTVKPRLAAPASWQLLRRSDDSTLQSSLWWRAVDEPITGAVTVTSSASTGLVAQIVAYSGTDQVAPQVSSQVEPMWRTTHTTPSLTVQPGDLVVSYWTDKTGAKPTTGWSVPSPARERTTLIAPWTAHRLSGLVADLDATSTPAGGLTATASSPTNLAVMWTVRLRPA